jgi:hypothetical protein
LLSADCSITGPGFPSVPALLTATSRRPKRDGLIDKVADIAFVTNVGMPKLRLNSCLAQLSG